LPLQLTPVSRPNSELSVDPDGTPQIVLQVVVLIGDEGDQVHLTV
jgi:hypothetical protein